MEIPSKINFNFYIGALSVLVRQNNIIWTNFFALENCLAFVLELARCKLFSINNLFTKLKEILLTHLHVIVLDVLFITFFMFNNYSIVLGDTANHSLCLHLAQLNHFSFFLLFFFPWLNTKVFRLFDRNFYNLKNILLFIMHFVLFYAVMSFFDKFSYVHEFIYADNRHYSFYYFRRIYLNEMLRHVMIIWTAIVYSLILLDNEKILLDTHVMSFLICCGLILVPAKLFEFRYFAPCYISLCVVLHFLSAKWKDLYYLVVNKYNVIWLIILNAISIYGFIRMPFKNPFFDFENSRMMW